MNLLQRPTPGHFGPDDIVAYSLWIPKLAFHLSGFKPKLHADENSERQFAHSENGFHGSALASIDEVKLQVRVHEGAVLGP